MDPVAVVFRTRLFWRLFASYVAIPALVACALGFLAANRLRAVRYEALQRSLYEESRLIYSLIAEDLKAKRPEHARQKLAALCSCVGCRLTLIDDEGHVIADSEADPSTMENHRLRPEIVQAAAEGEGSSIRFSHTLQEQMLYLAHRAEEPDAGIVYMRLAIPLAQVTTGLRIFDASIAAGVVAAVLLAALASAWLAWRQAATVLELGRTAQAVAAGDLNARTFLHGGEAGVLGVALNTLAQSLAESKAQAARARDELLGILESMSEGVIVTDHERRIVLANATAATMLDFSSSQVSGKMLWEVIRETQVLQEAESAANSATRKLVRCGPIRGRFVGVTISPLSRQQGALGLLLVAHDTTEAVQFQELRKEFVANVSHELRTPLTLIKGFVETLHDGALHDPQKGPEYLTIIEKHVAQLTNLVNDLLELSRLESRPSVPHRARISLVDLIRKVADLMQPAAQKKRQALSIMLPPVLPVVSGDADYLERAVSNLLDNAIKYTPENGSIRVSAEAVNSKIVIEVADNGIGIPPADLPRIFERFYRVDKSRSREMGGTGLGLAIVKHIAQVHGGSVEVESQQGKGSVFRVVLPVA
jgi:two-component system phosphate regulon sensor histidine kinase PhoR